MDRWHLTHITAPPELWKKDTWQELVATKDSFPAFKDGMGRGRGHLLAFSTFSGIGRAEWCHLHRKVITGDCIFPVIFFSFFFIRVLRVFLPRYFPSLTGGT